MSELDNKIAKLYTTNSIVNLAFRRTDNKTEALKLAVVIMAENLEILENEMEKPRELSWEVRGNLTICPKCLEIKEQADNLEREKLMKKADK